MISFSEHLISKHGTPPESSSGTSEEKTQNMLRRKNLNSFRISVSSDAQYIKIKEI
jgi:hypothetical protein